MWNFEDITNHRKPPDNSREVKVLWDTGEETWETMNTTK